MKELEYQEKPPRAASTSVCSSGLFTPVSYDVPTKQKSRHQKQSSMSSSSSNSRRLFMPEIHPPEGMQSRIKPFDLNDAEITPFRPSMAGMAEDCAQLRERIRFLEKELQKKD